MEQYQYSATGWGGVESLHWLLLWVLKVQISSLTTRGDLSTSCLWKTCRPKKGTLLCASRGQFRDILSVTYMCVSSRDGQIYDGTLYYKLI